MVFVARLMFSTGFGSLHPGNIRLDFTALFTGDERYERRDVKADIQVVFMQPASFAEP
jgi:hypothetical protein